LAKQVFFEDVEVGTEITPLTKHPTTQQLVKWAGASEDFYQIHYDKDFALNNNLPGVIVHGRLKAAFLGQLVVDWIGEGGTLKELNCNYRAMDVPGEDLTCKGKVTRKYVEEDGHYLECEIWLENAKGEKTTEGKAVVLLPSRG
jgi:acyl dehydratase